MENKTAKLLIVLAGIFVVFIFWAYLRAVGDSRFLSDSEKTGEAVEKNKVNEELQVSDYFEESFKERSDSETNKALEEDTDLCEIDGEVVKEGTVKFGTTCVNEPG